MNFFTCWIAGFILTTLLYVMRYNRPSLKIWIDCAFLNLFFWPIALPYVLYFVYWQSFWILFNLKRQRMNNEKIMRKL